MVSAFAVVNYRKQEEMIFVSAKMQMMKEIGCTTGCAMKKQKSVRNSEYLEWIRTLPCIVCTMAAGYIPSMEFRSDPHHVPLKGHGGMGMKTDDSRVINLCRFHHELYHQIGRDSFEDRFSLDYEYIIERLNTAYGKV